MIIVDPMDPDHKRPISAAVTNAGKDELKKIRQPKTVILEIRPSS